MQSKEDQACIEENPMLQSNPLAQEEAERKEKVNSNFNETMVMMGQPFSLESSDNLNIALKDSNVLMFILFLIGLVNHLRQETLEQNIQLQQMHATRLAQLREQEQLMTRMKAEYQVMQMQVQEREGAYNYVKQKVAEGELEVDDND